MNRIAVISDIHSNLPALEAVLAHVHTEGVDQVYCLGDVIGYGAEANETIDLVRTTAEGRTVLGNHDKAINVDDAFYTMGFNAVARSSLLYHKRVVSESNKRWLESLPVNIRMDDILFCHGAPGDTDQYIFNEFDITMALDAEEAEGADLIFYGHTHVPLIVFREGSGVLMVERPPRRKWDSFEIELEPDNVYMINPGSVGQPRDGNAAACYAILDRIGNRLTLHRVTYDVAKAQKSIRAARLPEFLADRLFEGR